MIELSVVIPTYNSARALGRTLEALSAQEFPPERFEVIVLDDGSTDDTPAVAQAQRGTLRLCYSRQENQGRAAARNAGSRVARGPVLLYLDADVIPSPTLLARHAAYYGEDRPVGVQGRTVVHPDAKRTPFMRVKELVPDLTIRRHADLSPYHVITRNLSIRAEDLWAVGGFDEGFPGYGWEDIELGLRLRAHGVRFYYDPEALGYHYDVETLERTREKLRQAGEGAVYFWNKHQRRAGLGLFLEIHPAVRWLKWLVYRTGPVGAVVRRVLPWAERQERLWICSECYNYLLWEAYYDGVFRGLRGETGT